MLKTKLKYINNRFNLLSDLVPLIGPRRQIPIGKTSLFIEKKPIFRWTKNLQGRRER